MLNSTISMHSANHIITIDYSHGRSYLSVDGRCSLYDFGIEILTRAEADGRPTIGFRK